MELELIIGLIALFLSLIGIVYTWYVKTKEGIIEDIKFRLSQCRSYESWTLNSESHLFEWMCNTEEGQLHHRNLYTLIQIRKRIYEYQNKHLDI